MSGRIRTIKPEWLEDEDILRAGSDARVLSVALILLADDYGRGRCIPEALAGQVFPFDPEPSRVFREGLARLTDVGFVTLYGVRGQRYFAIRNWSKHQKVDRPGKPRVPAPETSDSDELESSRVSREGSRAPRECLAPDHDHDQDHEPTPTTIAREGVGDDPVSRDTDSTHSRASARAAVMLRAGFNATRVAKLFGEARKHLGHGGYRLVASDAELADETASWAIDEDPESPDRAVARSVAGFFEYSATPDGAKRFGSWEFKTWAKDPGHWHAYRSSNTRGAGEVSTEFDESQNPEYTQ